MIVSMHVTHTSVGGTEGLNDVVPLLESEIGKRIDAVQQVTEYIVVRSMRPPRTTGPWRTTCRRP